MKISLLKILNLDIGFVKLDTWRKKLAWVVGVAVIIFCVWLVFR